MSLDVPKLMEWRLAIPPLHVQHRLVAKLREVLGEILDAESRLTRAARLEQSLQSEAIAQALHLRHESLPAEWAIKTLPEVADLSTGGTPSRSHAEYFGPGHLWVKIGDLTEGSVGRSEETITDAGLVNSNAELLPAGTVLLAMYGASIGRTGILDREGATNQAICSMRPRADRVIGEYLLLALQAHKTTFVTAGYGGAQPNISQRYLRQFEIPVPPLKEQHRIVQSVLNFRRDSEQFDNLLRKSRKLAAQLRRSALAHGVLGGLDMVQA